MPRNRPNNRARGQGRGRGGINNASSNRTTRGSHPHDGSGIGKRGSGRYKKHRKHHNHHLPHHPHNKDRHWDWQHDHYHGDADSSASSSDTDSSDLDFVDPSKFPPAESNVFSILLNASKGKGKGKPPPCIRPDCKRAKRDLEWIRRKDRRLRRALRRWLEYMGSDLVEFLLDGDEHMYGYDSDDSETMDWTPEPTVQLIVRGPPSPEPPSPPKAGFGSPWEASPPQRPQQQQQQQAPPTSAWGPNPDFDDQGQCHSQGQCQTHPHAGSYNPFSPMLGPVVTGKKVSWLDE
ncbi:hypothetical protein SCUP234_07293 [Seiridium cupressi]